MRGGGVRANLDAAGGGTYLIFPLVKLILGPPLPDNYCTVPYNWNLEFTELHKSQITNSVTDSLQIAVLFTRYKLNL